MTHVVTITRAFGQVRFKHIAHTLIEDCHGEDALDHETISLDLVEEEICGACWDQEDWDRVPHSIGFDAIPVTHDMQLLERRALERMQEGRLITQLYADRLG